MHFYLLERQSSTETETQRKIFYLLTQVAGGYNCQGYAKPKPKAMNSMQVSNTNGRDPSTCTIICPIGSGGRTQSHAFSYGIQMLQVVACHRIFFFFLSFNFDISSLELSDLTVHSFLVFSVSLWNYWNNRALSSLS